MPNKIASGWNLNSTVFWIIVVQSIFIVIIVAVLIALLVHSSRMRRREQAARAARRREYLECVREDLSDKDLPVHGSPDMSHYVEVSAGPDFGRAVRQYTEDVLRSSLQGAMSPYITDREKKK